MPRHTAVTPELAEDYRSGDVYHALAVMCGLTKDDAETWKATPEGKSQRKRMKALQLGVNYGMGVASLSRGLGRHLMIGSEVIIRHQQFPTPSALCGCSPTFRARVSPTPSP